MENIEQWHVDRRIPLAPIIAGGIFLITQLSGIVWFGSQLANRVSNVEVVQIAQGAQIQNISRVSEARGERLATLEEGQRNVSQLLRDISRKLDQIGANIQPRPFDPPDKQK